MHLPSSLMNSRDCSLIAQVVCQTSLRMLLFVHSFGFFFLFLPLIISFFPSFLHSFLSLVYFFFNNFFLSFLSFVVSFFLLIISCFNSFYFIFLSVYFFSFSTSPSLSLHRSFFSPSIPSFLLFISSRLCL